MPRLPVFALLAAALAAPGADEPIVTELDLPVEEVEVEDESAPTLVSGMVAGLAVAVAQKDAGLIELHCAGIIESSPFLTAVEGDRRALRAGLRRITRSFGRRDPRRRWVDAASLYIGVLDHDLVVSGWIADAMDGLADTDAATRMATYDRLADGDLPGRTLLRRVLELDGRIDRQVLVGGLAAERPEAVWRYRIGGLGIWVAPASGPIALPPPVAKGARRFDAPIHIDSGRHRRVGARGCGRFGSGQSHPMLRARLVRDGDPGTSGRVELQGIRPGVAAIQWPQLAGTELRLPPHPELPPVLVGASLGPSLALQQELLPSARTMGAASGGLVLQATFDDDDPSRVRLTLGANGEGSRRVLWSTGPAPGWLVAVDRVTGLIAGRSGEGGRLHVAVAGLDSTLRASGCLYTVVLGSDHDQVSGTLPVPELPPGRYRLIAGYGEVSANTLDEPFGDKIPWWTGSLVAEPLEYEVE